MTGKELKEITRPIPDDAIVEVELNGVREPAPYQENWKELPVKCVRSVLYAKPCGRPNDDLEFLTPARQVALS